MIIKLGIIAGEILTVLEDVKRPIDLEEVESLIEQPTNIILMAFGWLIRQGHIHIHQRDNTFYICCSVDDKARCP